MSNKWCWGTDGINQVSFWREHKNVIAFIFSLLPSTDILKELLLEYSHVLAMVVHVVYSRHFCSFYCCSFLRWLTMQQLVKVKPMLLAIIKIDLKTTPFLAIFVPYLRLLFRWQLLRMKQQQQLELKKDKD